MSPIVKSLAISLLLGGVVFLPQTSQAQSQPTKMQDPYASASASSASESVDVSSFKTMENGLKYKVLEEGTGPEAKPGQRVEVHYTGWLFQDGQKGEKFDSSHDRNQPFPFTINRGRVIRGWDLGVAGMQKGEKRHLIIPPDLGYGARGAGGRIPPNATLMFEVELLDITGEPDPEPEPLDMSEFKTRDNGLKVHVIEEGSGDAAEPGQMMKIHYTGHLMDDGKLGRKFDASRDRGRAVDIKLGLNQPMEAWDMVLEGKKAGAEVEVIIPPELGYGEQNMGVIPPNSTLYFKLEVEEVSGEPFGPPEPIEMANLQTSDSGLKYEVTAEGSGEAAESGDLVAVHYEGWLVDDGKRTIKFDSSRERGEPLKFPVGTGRVIPGWDEALVGMKPGGKKRLLVPPDLGYGARAMGPIPENATLYFEVELISAEDAPPQMQQRMMPQGR